MLHLPMRGHFKLSKSQQQGKLNQSVIFKQHHQLGKSDLTVSAIGLGSWAEFGDTPTDFEQLEQVRTNYSCSDWTLYRQTSKACVEGFAISRRQKNASYKPILCKSTCCIGGHSAITCCHQSYFFY